jgi:hypothetical protein
MNEVNNYFKTIYLNIFNKMKEWQEIHQKTCDLFFLLKEDFEKMNIMKEEKNFGIFSFNNLFIKEVQIIFFEKIDKKFELLKKQM